MQHISWPQTPLGPLHAEVNFEGHLTALKWGNPPKTSAEIPNHPAQMELNQYFNKNILTNSIFKHFKPSGTPFQHRVWAELLKIPHGQTRTYGDLAKALNTSPRAIGGAVGSNPLPIFIPCHRVMGAAGQLTGFSAPGGLKTKTWLLQHEGILL